MMFSSISCAVTTLALALASVLVPVAAWGQEPAVIPSQILRPQDHPDLMFMMNHQHSPLVAASSGDWLALGFPDALIEPGEFWQSGRVPLWKRVNGLWQLRQVLELPDLLPKTSDDFGREVLMDGPNLLVGDGYSLVHAYRLEKDAWVYCGRLAPPGEVLLMPGGYGSVFEFALSGDTAVLSSSGNGWVDVFQRRGAGWAHVTRLKDTGVLGQVIPGQTDGARVAISGETIYVAEKSASGWLRGARVAVYQKAGTSWVKSRDLRFEQSVLGWLRVSQDQMWAGFEHHYNYPYESQPQSHVYATARGYERVQSWNDVVYPLEIRGRMAIVSVRMAPDSRQLYERMPDQRWRQASSLSTEKQGLRSLHLAHLTPHDLVLAGRNDSSFEIRVFPRTQEPSFVFDHTSAVPMPPPAEDAAATLTRVDAGEFLLGREAKPLVTLTATHSGPGAAAELGVTTTGDTADFTLSTRTLLLQPGQKGEVKVSFKPLTAGEKHLWVNFIPKGKTTPVARYEMVVRAVKLAEADQVTFTRQPKSGLYCRGDFEGLHAEVTGAGPITFRWLKDGKPVPKETTLSLWPKEGGRYQLEATNPRGTFLSETAVLGFFGVEKETVYTTPGTLARCAITLSGPSDLLTVQWCNHEEVPLRNGPAFNGVTTPELIVGSAPEMGEGAYYLARVRLQVGSTAQVYSDGVSLLSRRPPVILGLNVTEFLVGQHVWVIPEVDYPGGPASGYECTYSGLPSGDQAGVYTVKVTCRVDIYTVTKSVRVTVLPNGPVPGIYWCQMERRAEFPEVAEMMLDVNRVGSYTGSLCAGTTRLPLKGGLAAMGQWRSPERPFPVKLDGKSYVFWIEAPYGFNSEQPVYDLFIRRADFALTSRQVLRLGSLKLLKAHSAAPDSGFTGSYNFGLRAPEPVPAPGGTQAVPQGHGFGTLKVAESGRVTYTAELPDGSKLTGATWVSPGDLRVPVYQWSTATRALLRGSPVLDQPGSLTWERTAQKGRLYPSGTAPQVMEFLADRYQAVTGQPLLAGLAHEIQFAAYDTAPTPVGVTLTSKHGALFGSGEANPLKTTLSMTKATGLFTGQFSLTDPDPVNAARKLTRTVKYRGILLQGLGQGVGYFQVPLLPDLQAVPPTKLTTSPIVSGSVMLRTTQANP